MQALQLLNQGHLDEAIQAATEQVKQTPSDVASRQILAELFCLRGEFDRADKHLETVILQSPEAGLSVSLVRQLIRADTSRRECWNQGRLPEFLSQPDEALETHVKALVLMRSGQTSEAFDLLASLEESRPSIAGSCNSEAFTDFRDLDDTCSSFFEVLTSTGKYYWIPTSRVESVEFDPVERPRDLLWRQARMIVADGPDGVVYVPALYSLTDPKGDSSLRLGRATQWSGSDSEPVRGIGQRIYGLDDKEVAIMEIKSLEFKRG